MAIVHRKDGKTLYAVAWRTSDDAGFVYLQARDRGDAFKQLALARKCTPKGAVIDGFAPAVGAFTPHEERKRIYVAGF